MKPTPRIEALESRDLFSASLAGVAPPPDSAALNVHTASAADTFTTQPTTSEAKEQFTRNKPHVMPT